MRSYKSEVKVYKRKKYTQYIINLKKDNPFNESEMVLIYPENEIKEYLNKNKSLEDTIKQREITINDLKEDIESLEEFKKYKVKYGTLLNDMDRLRNDMDRLRTSKDHLQERFNKSQDEVIQLQKMINRLTNLTLFDRLLNRIPDDIKELKAAPGNE